MSARSFRSVFMVASCAGAALGCYLVSLRVASERAALENVETKIVLAQRDLRLLQTEIGTRGRLAQLERWNVKVLALSAPSADQFLNGGFELAKMTAPPHTVDFEAPVVMASASTDTPRPRVEGVEPMPEAPQDLSPTQIMHVASLKRDTTSDQPRAIVSLKRSRPVADDIADKPRAKTVTQAKSPAVAKARSTSEPVKKLTVVAKAQPTAQPAKKPADTLKKDLAVADPLAPLAASAKSKKVATTTLKDAAKTQ
jgi:hypothetical protein